MNVMLYVIRNVVVGSSNFFDCSIFEIDSTSYATITCQSQQSIICKKPEPLRVIARNILLELRGMQQQEKHNVFSAQQSDELHSGGTIF